MSLSWDRLRILDAVARAGSTTRAAQALHMTGPAVSQQLRRIEAEAKTRVVEPDGRGIKLTPQGKLLAEYARLMADTMQRLENALDQEHALAGELRIGAPASVIRDILPPVLLSLRQTLPHSRLHLEDGETDDHLERLTRGALDLVLAESWDALPVKIPPRVRSQLLCRQPLFVVLPDAHPEAHRSSIGFSDLANESWTTCAEGSGAHTALTQAARQEGVEIDVSFFLADLVTQHEVIQQGLAVGCTPHIADTPGITFIPLEKGLSRDILILTENKTPSLLLTEAVAALR